MDEFENIKIMTQEAIKTNMKNISIVANWKKDIRQCLMRVRSKYINMID